MHSKRLLIILSLLVFLILVGIVILGIQKRKRIAEEAPATITLNLIQTKGGRVDWLHSKNIIAFDRVDTDGFYDIYTMSPDGSSVRCVTCDKVTLPGRNMGQPAWHPSGKYLVFQAEKKNHQFAPDWVSTPGIGVFNDLWVMDMETGAGNMLWEVKNGSNYGVLHAHLSADGKKLSWSDMYGPAVITSKQKRYGYWKLMVSDVVIKNDQMTLQNVKEYTPLGEGFYENHGFSPDGKKLIFTSNAKVLKNNIYAMNLADNAISTLTTDGYNEHALYSPDGTNIAWMHGPTILSADYWLMNADGSGKNRLTYFTQPGHDHYLGTNAVASDLSWGPDGKKFAGYVQLGTPFGPDYRQYIYIVDLIGGVLSSKEYCDANHPCSGGKTCYKFEDEEKPICWVGDPCEKCESKKCVLLESYPARVDCQ